MDIVIICLGTPGLRSPGLQLVSGGGSRNAGPQFWWSPVAPTPSFLIMIFLSCAHRPWASSGDGTDLHSGVVEGTPGSHKTPGSAPTELPGSPARPWLCVPQFPEFPRP